MSRVLLLFGGRSAEHEISCVSAVAIQQALNAAGYDVTPVGIDREGGWHLADPTDDPFVARGPSVEIAVPGGHLVGSDVDYDVVFPVLHGPYGEDGTIQGALEMAGVPYVGCGVLASAAAMHKDIAKRLLTHAGIPTAPWSMVSADAFGADPAGTVARLTAELGGSVFVKPNELGSSVGVNPATTEAELKDALEEALRHGSSAIVEEAIKGREIEVAVLDGPKASLPGEVLSANEWYDYEAKYVNEESRFQVPAPLDDAQTASVRGLACQAFTALECRGLARVDFFFEQGGRGFLINEVNTMPGFTPISGFPSMWEASGMSYPELCRALVEAALADRP
ncbi:MAG: D-alanine--D-alanine ligase [Acidimicrobiia bacterium]|nr:D-alanine--D-alanine ligase [Acidimicrobiia bacterium]